MPHPDPAVEAVYVELLEAHEAVHTAKAAYKAAADRRRALALSLGIDARTLSVTLGISSGTAHALLKAAVDGTLPATIHKRKPSRRSRQAVEDPTVVPALNLVTGAESALNAEADAPALVGATF